MIVLIGTLQPHGGMIEMDKEWYKSKTIWAGLIIMGVGVCKAYGIDVPIEAVVSVASGLGIVGIRDALN